jgi:hypothetical protein
MIWRRSRMMPASLLCSTFAIFEVLQSKQIYKQVSAGQPNDTGHAESKCNKLCAPQA